MVSVDDGCPFFQPSTDVKALHHHAEVARRNKEAAGYKTTLTERLRYSLSLETNFIILNVSKRVRVVPISLSPSCVTRKKTET